MGRIYFLATLPGVQLPYPPVGNRTMSVSCMYSLVRIAVPRLLVPMLVYAA